jgi:catechol 2,3-dioxygenase-like lactoylglutathione lyase family enzyme
VKAGSRSTRLAWLLAPAVALASATLGLAQAPQAAFRVTGVNHVALKVSDAAAARAFYGDMLGLSERTADKPPRLVYAIGARQSVMLDPVLKPGEDERLLHVAYETTDVKAVAARLTARGLDVKQPADRCAGSAVQVTDPDGHTIEFVQVTWPPDGGPAAPTSALSTRLLHAGLIVADEQRAHGFYREALGFIEIWRGGRPEGVTRWVNMRVPDGTDYLEYMLSTSPPDRRERGVLHHLCLRVDDMQAAWEEVARRALRYKQPTPGAPQIGVNGRYQLNLYDPDGTRVELMEPFTVRNP